MKKFHSKFTEKCEKRRERNPMAQGKTHFHRLTPAPLLRRGVVNFEIHPNPNPL